MTTPQPLYGRFTEDRTPQAEMTWDLRLDEADELMRKARRLAHDNLRMEGILKVGAMRDAIEQLELAIAAAERKYGIGI